MIELSKEILEKIEKLIPRYPQKRSAVLPLLHVIQEEKGHVSREAMEWIAEKLEIEPINVYELVTFYPMLREKPAGKIHIKVCRTLPCALSGAYKVCETLQKELDCPLNHTTEDGKFTIEFVECIASCGSAPVIQINETLYENIIPEKAKDFACKLKEEVAH